MLESQEAQRLGSSGCRSTDGAGCSAVPTAQRAGCCVADRANAQGLGLPTAVDRTESRVAGLA